MAPMPDLPQQPLGAGDVTVSELMPFRSKKISMVKSRALVPLTVTALTCLALFSSVIGFDRNSPSAVNDIYLYMDVFAAFMVFVMFAGLYFYAGERKNLLWYFIPGAFTALQLYVFFGGILPNPYAFVFRTLLPGDRPANDFMGTFISYWFGAGMMEELIKAVPALVGLVIAWKIRASNQPPSPIAKGLAIDGPVDALLYGAAAGAGFILYETLVQYVPNEANRVYAQSHDPFFAFFSAMMLLIPRVLNGIIGHMAYAGIFGYFIGLAVSHKRSAIKLLLVGWGLSALLHTLWDTGASGFLFGVKANLYIVGLATLFFFVACLLKAKQLEVSRLGGPIDGHSILAATVTPTGPTAPGGVVPPSAGGLAGVFTGLTSAVEKAVGFTARTTVPNPGAVPPAIPAQGISIGTGATRYALAAGQVIDFSALFAAAGVPAGFSGAIAGTPGALVLRNTGAAPWPIAAADGSSTTVPPGGSVVAQPGSRMQLGAATIDLQAY